MASRSAKVGEARRSRLRRLGALHEIVDGLVRRRLEAGRGGEPEDLAVQVVDLGGATVIEIVEHRGAGMGIDLHHGARHAEEQRVRQPEDEGRHARDQPPDARRADPRGADDVEPLLDARGHHAPVAGVGELLAQGDAGERVDRVVQVEEELAPLDGEDASA